MGHPHRHYPGQDCDLPLHIFPTAEEREAAAERVKVKRAARMLQRRGGLLFFRIGRLGGSVYIARKRTGEG